MAPATGISWMMVLLLVLTLTTTLLLAAYFLFVRKQRSDPSCGNCGYAARGISTLTCPECGSDLREVGIVRHQPSRFPMFVTFLVASIIVLCAVAFAMALLIS